MSAGAPRDPPADDPVARIGRLQALTAALNAARVSQEVADVSLQLGMQALGAQAGGACLLLPGGREQALVSLAGVGASEISRQGWWTFPIDAPFPVNDAVRENRLIFMSSAEEFLERYPAVAPTVIEAGYEAYAAAPLEFERRMLGCINFNFRERRRFTEGDAAFLLAVARQCSQALERARLYDELARSRDEARAAERRARLLAEASQVMGSSLEYEATLANIALRVVPELADWCAVDLVDDRGTIERLTAAHQDPEKVRWALEVQPGIRPTTHDRGGIGAVIRTGEPAFLPTLTDEDLKRLAPSPRHLEIWREMRITSAIVVPLIARERVLGSMSFIRSGTSAPYVTEELELALEIGRRAALAVDNARLYTAAERARRDAEQANRAKTEFLAVMSHELRTPLNAIAGYAELLRLGVRGPVSEPQIEDLERIRRNQRHLLSLINDLLNFAKLEAGHVRLEIRPVALAEILADLESLIAPQLSARRLTYASERCVADLCVRADPERLEQILLNLLSNAIKFTAPGGCIQLACAARDQTIEVSVQDTGIGIEADQLERIFEPFVQLERTLTSRHEGAGLGLAISRDLARHMGGDLTARSTPGEGSTFTVTLPRARSDE